MNKNALRLQKIINALWIRKKVMKLKRPFLCQIFSGKKQKRVYIFPWIAFISITGFKITDSFIFQKLVFALQCSFCDNRALAS